MIVTPNIHTEIAIAHSGIAIGNMDPRDKFATPAEQVRLSRRMLRSAMPHMDNVYVAKPLGGVEFVDVGNADDPRIDDFEDFEEIGVNADALITNSRKQGLMMNMADCIPLAVAQPSQGILAMIHLGWKGATFRLHDDVLDYAHAQYNFDPTQAVAYLGPSIAKASFTTEKLHPVQEADEDWTEHITENGNLFNVDIPGFVVATLKKQGIRNISVSPIDTGAPNSGHFSHTRHIRDGAPNGRNGFIATLAQ